MKYILKRWQGNTVVDQEAKDAMDDHISHCSIPFCHHLYLSATFKQCFTGFAGNETSTHTVYR
jgi:hypothetical protein